MADVTPIRPGVKVAKKRRAKAVTGVTLREFDQMAGFNIYDVMNALHGICHVLDFKASDLDNDESQELATAAKVLSSMLRDRVVA